MVLNTSANILAKVEESTPSKNQKKIKLLFCGLDGCARAIANVTYFEFRGDNQFEYF